MKLLFTGQKRVVYPHEHQVLVGDQPTPLQWTTPLFARGSVKNIELTGNFDVEFHFEEGELNNWVEVFCKEDPVSALKLAEKILSLTNNEVIAK